MFFIIIIIISIASVKVDELFLEFNQCAIVGNSKWLILQLILEVMLVIHFTLDTYDI